MDGEPDEMRSLGVVGICKEVFNLLRSHLRLFVSLAFTLVLPLGLVIFCHTLVSDPLMNKIGRNEDEKATEIPGSPAAVRTQNRLDAEFFALAIITILYFVFVLAFSLLSTAAIVYSVACIYTAKGLTYVKVISVVPRVWKRLLFTFLWANVLIFLYYVALFFIFVILLFLSAILNVNLLILFIPVVILFYCLLIYFNLVWHLASVISVLEESYGIGALKKSAELIKGKRRVACVVFVVYGMCTIFVVSLFNIFVNSNDHVNNYFGRFFFGLFLLLLWTCVHLIGILIQTVVYFVCKSYHNENIDRYALSEHLDGYLGEYVPLKGPVSLEALEAELEDR